MSELLSALEEISRRFRDAFQQTDFSDVDLNRREFPKNCCHHAVKLLGLHFFENDYGIWQRASGEREKSPGGHLWLVRDSIVVDITADQFADGPGREIVSTNSLWHQQWTWKLLPQAENYYAEVRSSHIYGPLYQRIVSNLDS